MFTQKTGYPIILVTFTAAAVAVAVTALAHALQHAHYFW